MRGGITGTLVTTATRGAIMWIRLSLILVGACTVAGCGAVHSNSAVSWPEGTGQPKKPQAPAAGSGSAERTLSVARTVGPNQTVIVLRVKRFGRLTFHCGHAGTSSASFTVPRSGATTMIVVGQAGHASIGKNVDPGHRLRSPAEGSASLEQQWQITPWSSAGASLMTVTLSALEGSPPGSPGCGVSAEATISPS